MKRLGTICSFRRSWQLGVALVLLLLFRSADKLHAQTPTFTDVDSVLVFSSQSSSRTTEIRTTSTTPRIVQWYVRGKDAAYFTVSNGNTIVNIGTVSASNPLTISIDFLPTQKRQYAAELAIVDSNAMYGKLIQLSGVGQGNPQLLQIGMQKGFGDIFVNGGTKTESVTLVNPNSDGAFTINSVSLKNGTVFGFKDLGTFPNTLAPQNAEDVQVTFTPTQAGYSIDSLYVNYNDYDGNPRTAVYGLLAYAKNFRLFDSIIFEGGNTYRPVPYGQWDYMSLGISAASDDSVHIDSVKLTGDTNFHLSPNPLGVPVMLVPHDYPELKFRLFFVAGSDFTKSSYNATLHIWMTGSGHTLSKEVNFFATTYDSTREKIVALDTGTTDTIHIKGNKNKKSEQTIILQNNQVTPITVKNVGLKDGANFAATVLYPQGSFPLTIQPNDALYVTITVTNSGTGPYKDQLIVVTDDKLTSLTYNLESEPLATDGVVVLHSTNAELLAQPNPSNGPVNFTIADAAKAKITVYDLLGNAVYSQESVNGHWTWSGYTSTGTHAANGMYLIRAQGTKQDGTSFQTSTQVLLAP